MTTTAHRSEIFALSDEYVEKGAAFSPIECTSLGIPGFEDQLDDFSLAHAGKSAAYARDVLNRAKAIQPIDDIDRIAQAVLIERTESRLQLHDSREAYVAYGQISSPVAAIRSVFSIMDLTTPEQVVNAGKRMAAIEGALKSWRDCIEEVHAEGHRTARRQVLAVAGQLKTHSEGAYSKIASEIASEIAPGSADIAAAAKQAEAACADMSKWLEEVHAPRSAEADGVGEKRYAPWARYFTGAELDLRATYEWGKQDLQAINDRMWRAAAKIAPHCKTLAEVAEFCEQSDHLKIHGADNLLQELKDFTEAAIKKVDGIYFDIDDRIRFCDARIAPEGSAAAPYYMPPSEDLKRPGTTWYPTLGNETFNFWHIASTWYHEAVPGHHLQCATAIIEKDRLTRFQRTGAWISGYGEGWALYAERFMYELGAFEDPALELGYLSGQALRAARIVVDIGMHLGLDDFDGKPWNAESAYNLMVERALIEPAFAQSEIERYLSWPGQAISYKVGERIWMEIREETKTRLGAAFDIKAFHNYALKVGPMGLDSLRAEMRSFNG